MDFLDEEEKKELEARPIGCPDLSDMNLELRKQIAIKFEKFANENDDTMPKGYKEVYEKFPRWKFYTNEDGSSIKRVYGACETSDGEIRLHTVAGMFMFNNDTIGGTSQDDLVAIDEWSEEHLSRLNSGMIKYPEAFLDPLGWMMFINH